MLCRLKVLDLLEQFLHSDLLFARSAVNRAHLRQLFFKAGLGCLELRYLLLKGFLLPLEIVRRLEGGTDQTHEPGVLGVVLQVGHGLALTGFQLLDLRFEVGHQGLELADVLAPVPIPGKCGQMLVYFFRVGRLHVSFSFGSVLGSNQVFGRVEWLA